MNSNESNLIRDFRARSQTFRDLMAHEIHEILLISSPYNIFNLEEDGGLTSRIINEYKGLNLCYPPRITGASSLGEALDLLAVKEFDMVLIVPQLAEMNAFFIGSEIKKINPELPVILFSPTARGLIPLLEINHPEGIDKHFIWSGHPDLLLALVKNAEDHLNAGADTRRADVRVVLLLEDSPDYYSFFLPIIYREIVTQTQALMDIGLNDNEKLLTMRMRPKILLARDHEEAVALYERYQSHLLCVISDTRVPRRGKMDGEAGIRFLSRIREEIPELPLLLMSSETENRKKAEGLKTAVFLDKNSANLRLELHDFFLTHLGFGDFVFRMPDGREIDRAANLLELERKLADIPTPSIAYHASRNHFSNYLMARSEIPLALQFRSVKPHDFTHEEELRQYIITNIHDVRRRRQNGIVSTFNRRHFDSDVRQFIKIGEGSLGGKARGLAFMSGLFRQFEALQKKYPEIDIHIPKTLVICTDVFEEFIRINHLQHFAGDDVTDDEVRKGFLDASLPKWLIRKLKTFLMQVDCPIAVRSSSQLEDAHYQPYAGLYGTFMIPNNHPDPSTRLAQLTEAIKRVYASTCYRAPKTFYRNTSATQPFNEAMAVIIQQLTGEVHGDYFYPTLSGVVQSVNYYPFSGMKAEDGVAHVALGFGKTVVEGEQSLRFSPRSPHSLPQFSRVEDILKNAQQSFYALRMKSNPDSLNFLQDANLEKRGVETAEAEFPVRALSSTYVMEENRIRDTFHVPGPKVLTFAPVLKYNTIRLSQLLGDLMDLGKQGLGAPVEIEFSVNLYPEKSRKSEFAFLQIRPMPADTSSVAVSITPDDQQRAFCRSTRALGNGINEKISDIVYVKPDDFKPDATVKIAGEIHKVNARLLKGKRPYLLVGPGRWGASDRWLGIPVTWGSISGAGAIVELRNHNLNAEPSQGSHFFHNITSLGIPYITVNELLEAAPDQEGDVFRWQWPASLPAVSETAFIRHVRLENPMVLKIDGRTSRCVMLSG